MIKLNTAAMFLALCLQISATHAERGRVLVTQESVVTDNGKLIQANSTHMNGNAKSKEYWQKMRDQYGYNAMRVLAYIGSWWQPGANTRAPLDPSVMNNVYSHLDAAVAVSAELGMYLIIDDHSGKINDYNKEDSRTFWKGVAPRYKNRTHVIYEIKNEPVGGEGTMDQKYAKKPGEVQYQADMYKLIRELAPQTHIICWSFCEARRGMLAVVKQTTQIDYTNASVGFHPYVVEADWAGVRELIDAGYPAINTELGYIGTSEWSGIKDLPGYFPKEIDKIRHSITMSERLKVSWIQLYHLEAAATLYSQKLWLADDGKASAVRLQENSYLVPYRSFPQVITGTANRSSGHIGNTRIVTIDGKRLQKCQNRLYIALTQ